MSDIVERARERLKHIKDDGDAVLIDMLVTHVERLRTALREIADFEAPNFKWTCQTMRRKAKEALSNGRD